MFFMYRWSDDFAVSVLRQKTGISTFAAKAEIEKIVTHPGRATSAAYGFRIIRQLRQKAEDRLGKNTFLAF